MSYAEAPKEQPAPAEQAQKNKPVSISTSTTVFSDSINFFDEIPRDIRKESIVGENTSFLKKLKYFRAYNDRKKWEKVEDSAKTADQTLAIERKKHEKNEAIDTNKSKDAVQGLNKSCFEYVGKNKKIGFEAANEQEKAEDDPNKLEIGAHGRKMKNLIKKRLFTADKLIRKSFRLFTGNSGRKEDLGTGQMLKRDIKITLGWGSDFIKQRDNFPLFQNGDPKPEDIRQGHVGDCWLQASLISFLKTFGSEPIKSLFTDLGGGKVAVKIHDAVGKDKNGIIWEPKFVLVDKQIVADRYYNESETLWPHILQQAIIKANVVNHYEELEGKSISKEKKDKTSYRSINGGDPYLALGICLGSNKGGSIHYDTTFDKIRGKNEIDTVKARCDALFNHISKNLENHKAIVVSFKNNKKKEIGKKSGFRGLEFGHAYSIVGCEEDSNKERWVSLINPWGNRGGIEYYFNTQKNKLSRSSNMKNYSENEKNNGIFKIKLKTVYEYLKDLTTMENSK